MSSKLKIESKHLFLFAACLVWACGSFKVKQHVSPEGSAIENWTQFGGDPTRSNFHSETVDPPLKNIWSYKASSAVGRSLVAIDNVLYLTTLDGKFEAVDIRTGEKIGKEKTHTTHESALAFRDGHLILASRYGGKTLANFDLKTGKYLWRIDAGDIASEPLIVDDAIYISALYNHVDKYDVTTGEKFWNFKTDGQLRSSPALSDNTVVVGCDNGSLYAVNAKTGELRWQFETGASISATPIIWEDTVFAGSLDSTFYALSLTYGDAFWTFHAERPIFESAATNGDRVIFGTSDGKLYCLDTRSGREVWRYQAKSAVSTAPLISGKVVYFGSLDTYYYCLNLETGRELWRFETKGRIRTSPIIWGNYMFGASEDKFVYAFLPSDSTIASRDR